MPFHIWYKYQRELDLYLIVNELFMIIFSGRACLQLAGASRCYRERPQLKIVIVP